jgi:hypothetical protein
MEEENILEVKKKLVILGYPLGQCFYSGSRSDRTSVV